MSPLVIVDIELPETKVKAQTEKYHEVDYRNAIKKEVYKWENDKPSTIETQ